MNALENQLRKKLVDWEDWSLNEDKSEQGWESNYPFWSELMSLAKKLMTEKDVSKDALMNIEQCWSISEEDETLSDYAKQNYDKCFNLLLKLSESKDPKVRWQVYAALENGGEKALKVLKKGLEDNDNYAKRRAIISFSKNNPFDCDDIAGRFAESEDPYIRLAAIELIKTSKNPDFTKEMKQLLSYDPVDFIRMEISKLK